MSSQVNWDVARRVGTRLVSAGPAITRSEGQAVVAALHQCAEQAIDHVRQVSQLHIDSTARTLVVDRRGWMAVNCEAMAPLMGGRSSSATAYAAGVETGVLLAMVAPRVLGQYDPFTQRLVLVAPNIVQACRRLHLPADQFHLWVCVHEQTHRAQFHHAPWLADYVKDRITTITSALKTGPQAMIAGLRQLLASGGDTAGVVGSLVEPHALLAVEQISSLMTLLEGHADVMMDRVGTSVLPAVAQLRRRFEHRRDEQTGLVARLLGVAAKQRQYREGAEFCRRVIDAIGVTGLNQAFCGPDHIPTMADIRDPQSWIDAHRNSDGS